MTPEEKRRYYALLNDVVEPLGALIDFQRTTESIRSFPGSFSILLYIKGNIKDIEAEIDNGKPKTISGA